MSRENNSQDRQFTRVTGLVVEIFLVRIETGAPAGFAGRGSHNCRKRSTCEGRLANGVAAMKDKNNNNEADSREVLFDQRRRGNLIGVVI